MSANTVASHFETEGLSIIAYDAGIIVDPGAATNVIYSPRGNVVATYIGNLETWQHELALIGGMVSAMTSLTLPIDEATDWYYNGLGRHIELFSQDLGVVWEGLVNQITIVVGPATFVAGPVIDIANRAYVDYTEQDDSTSPPTSGIATSTVLQDDNSSKLRFGVMEGSQSIGNADALIAEMVRDTFLKDSAWPQRTQDLSLGAGTAISVQIDMVGYVNFLAKAAYNQYTNTGNITISSVAASKIQSVLGGTVAAPITPNADPNALFTVDNSSLYSNASLIHAFEAENRSGWDVIMEMVAMGDGTADDNRTMFGVYAGREVRYEVIPTGLQYLFSFYDPVEAIRGADKGEIFPWDVEVGRWLMFTDLEVGGGAPVNLRSDMRTLFSESVSYTAPYGLSMSGSKIRTLPQMLAYFGLV